MAPATVHLPNGQHLTVTPIFGGLYFKSNELTGHNHCPFPPGWTVVLNSEDGTDEDPASTGHIPEQEAADKAKDPKRHHLIHPFHKPTLHNDRIFISSMSQPASSDFKPPSSPTRQVAMMLWATLYWYFHQPEPDRHLTTSASERTPHDGKPKGEWRINISREGIFRGRVILPKLERMGLITTEESAVGADLDERAGEGWLHTFVSRRAFWQLDARTYLFTLSPAPGSPFQSNTPVHSRPGSPSRHGNERDSIDATASNNMFTGTGPFHSASNLPTYYPPPPPQFIYTQNIRHPIRPKPGKQGETVYTRYIPSLGQYLSFRIASTSQKPHTHHGPVSNVLANTRPSVSDSILPTLSGMTLEQTDLEYLHKWMNSPRVSKYWGEDGAEAHQEQFLKNSLRSRHSFPVIGLWDGKPFGYFEIYWVKEDPLGRRLGDVGNYDRGLHCLVGEEEFRGPHRVKVWLSALVHLCFMSDNRTETIIMEPRVDNAM
jgi:hypothetical protein